MEPFSAVRYPVEYRRKPTSVLAMRFTEETKNQVFNWVKGPCNLKHEYGGELLLTIQTIHGDKAIVRLGDWVLKGEMKGDYYPCKHDIFIKTYVDFK